MIKPTKFVQNVKPYSPPISGRKNKIRLDFNENNLPPSPKILKTLDKEFLKENINFYPEDTSLVQAISKKYNLLPNNVMITNGSNAAIQAIINSFVEKGNEVILPFPTFSIYELLFCVRGVKLKKIFYNSDLSFPTNSILKVISPKTKVIVLVSPNNPTGSSIGKKDINKILEKAKNTLVILDEAYCHFSRQNYIPLIKRYDNLVILRTFSKAYSLGGLRIGFLLGNSEIISQLLKSNLPYRVNFFSQKAALLSLSDQKYIEKNIKNILDEKNKLLLGFKKLGIKTVKTDTNFILFYAGIWAEMLYKELFNRGILIRNISKSQLLEGFLRVSIGTAQENKIFLKELKEIWKKRVIIFDLDGTLINVKNSFLKCTLKVFEHFCGKKLKSKDFDELKNLGGLNNDWDLVKYLLAKNGIRKSKTEIKKQFDKCYEKAKYNETLEIKKSVLGDLEKRFTLTVFSGRTKDEATFAYDFFGLNKYFKTTILAEDTGKKPKPHPLGIELIKQKLDSKLAIYVGDTVDDYNSAKSANIEVVMIARTKKQERIFKKMGFENILLDINKLVEVV